MPEVYTPSLIRYIHKYISSYYFVFEIVNFCFVLSVIYAERCTVIIHNIQNLLQFNYLDFATKVILLLFFSQKNLNILNKSAFISRYTIYSYICFTPLNRWFKNMTFESIDNLASQAKIFTKKRGDRSNFNTHKTC